MEVGNIGSIQADVAATGPANDDRIAIKKARLLVLDAVQGHQGRLGSL